MKSKYKPTDFFRSFVLEIIKNKNLVFQILPEMFARCKTCDSFAEEDKTIILDDETNKVKCATCGSFDVEPTCDVIDCTYDKNRWDMIKTDLKRYENDGGYDFLRFCPEHGYLYDLYFRFWGVSPKVVI